MKYRLIKKKYLTDLTIYVVQKRVLWYWEFIDCSADKGKMEKLLADLREGKPYMTREIMDE